MSDKLGSEATADRTTHGRQVEQAGSGARVLISGIGLYDTPDPKTGNLLGWAAFPGSGRVEWYPGCVTLTFPAKSVEISLDPGLRARPAAACISLDQEQVIYHPPPDQPHLLAMARLCDRFGIPSSAPDAPMRLSVELARLHEPKAFTPAGRDLTAEERRMSIAWLIDQEQEEGETVPAVLARIRERLIEYGLIDPDTSSATVHRLAKEGGRHLAKRQMARWRSRPPGRPKKGTHQAT
jgi:hypothetical protein